MSKPLPQVAAHRPVERVTLHLSHENPAVFVEMGATRSRSYQVRFDEHRRIAHGIPSAESTRETSMNRTSKLWDSDLKRAEYSIPSLTVDGLDACMNRGDAALVR